MLRLLTTWQIWALTIPLLLAVVLLTSWRLSVVWKAGGLQLPLSSSVRLTLIGAFFNTFLPGTVGGDAVRLYYAANSNRTHTTEVATLVILDRLVGLLGLLLLPLLTLGLAPRQVLSHSLATPLIGLSSAAAAGLVVVVFWFVQSDRGGTRGESTLGKLVGVERASRATRTLHSMRRAGGALMAALGLSIAAHGCTVAVIILLVTSIDAPTSAVALAVLIPFGVLSVAVPLTPGGLGVGEGVFETLVAIAGSSAGAEAILVWRVLTTFVDLSGAVFFVIGKTDASAQPSFSPLGRERET